MIQFSDFPLSGLVIEDYIVNVTNQPAYLAGLDYLSNIKIEPQILAISGSVGNGKTHLACGIANAFLERNSNAHIYIDSPWLLNKSILIPPDAKLLIFEIARPHRNDEIILKDILKSGVSVIVTSSSEIPYTEIPIFHIELPDTDLKEKCFRKFALTNELEFDTSEMSNCIQKSQSIREIEGFIEKHKLKDQSGKTS